MQVRMIQNDMTLLLHVTQVSPLTHLKPALKLVGLAYSFLRSPATLKQEETSLVQSCTWMHMVYYNRCHKLLDIQAKSVWNLK